MKRRGHARPPDVGRIGAAIFGDQARPGRWPAFLRVEEADDVVDVAADGVWLDCVHVDTGEPVVVRWGLRLLPGGGGVWTPPPRPGDEIIGIFHEGDPLNIAGVDVFPPEGSSKLPQAILDEPNAIHILGASERVILSSDTHIAATAGQKASIKAPLVELGDEGLGPLDGLVHGSGVDPLTGLTYTALGNTSAVVKAKK